MPNYTAFPRKITNETLKKSLFFKKYYIKILFMIKYVENPVSRIFKFIYAADRPNIIIAYLRK